MLCPCVLWAISASFIKLAKQSFNWTICSTYCLQQNRNHECAAQLWGRGIYSKSATKNRIRIRVWIRGRKPHRVRRTEARDQAECWEQVGASESEWEWEGSTDLHVVSGWGVGTRLGRRFVTSPATPWVLVQPLSKPRTVFEIFMVSLAFAEWQEDVLLLRRDQSLFHFAFNLKHA